MTAEATPKRNRRRQDLIVRQREQIRQLEQERLALAKAVLPDHPKGGFFNPLVAMVTLVLAGRILEKAR